MTPVPAVATRSLTKLYKPKVRPAVDAVTFTLEEGSVVGLLGPNGAGKTTLVKLLCGVTTPTAGRVQVLGGDPFAEAATVKQRVAVMHQSMPVDNMLSARDNLRIAASFRGLRWRTVRSRVDELIAQFGLEGAMDQLAFTLSGGQRRRLQLVRALLVVPRLLILDEPSTGLDVQGRRQMWEVIGKLNSEHETTVIWTSHYIEEIERNCTRVLIMDGGALIRDESPSVLVNEFGERSIRLRLPETADRDRLSALIPADCVIACAHDEIEIGGSLADGDLSAVIGLVRDAAERGATVEFRVPSLEDAYVALVDRRRGENG
ncbi:ABC transporter ATP-binding protein [Nonomuraea sp. NPDC049129]|uniref:ABC transporter ATP-binding protein n=1 Tax=Nonomuraea sp. NPDC049129 TaxID=3155272 RepID=UPI0033F02D3F